ncbi:MAG: N-acetylglucosaminyl-diphospho-decaprenol L-rhamnosyltransferase [Psychroserpens sp.]
MNVIIGIVSHGHGSLIEQNSYLHGLKKITGVKIVVKDNLGDPSLEKYCLRNGLGYISGSKGLGFGANNNFIFKYCQMYPMDYFLVMNPDVYITVDNFKLFIKTICSSNNQLFTVDLYRNFEMTIRDNSVRKFPKLTDFFTSFLFSRNSTVYDRSKSLGEVDWCAGSFICFSKGLFEKLNGFDEGFFMYCEDLDICKRSNDEGYKLVYIPEVKAVHTAAFNNRNVFTKHFFWHICSVMRYLVKNRLKGGV